MLAQGFTRFVATIANKIASNKNEWKWSKTNLGANTPLDNRTDKFVMPVFSLNVINIESRAINRLACLEFISVPSGAGNFGRGNGHCHGQQRTIVLPHGLSRVGSVSCRVAKEESSHEREVS